MSSKKKIGGAFSVLSLFILSSCGTKGPDIDGQIVTYREDYRELVQKNYIFLKEDAVEEHKDNLSKNKVVVHSGDRNTASIESRLVPASIKETAFLIE